MSTCTDHPKQGDSSGEPPDKNLQYAQKFLHNVFKKKGGFVKSRKETLFDATVDRASQGENHHMARVESEGLQDSPKM
eukprot:3677267-Amphidinium_carterae.1